MFQILYFFGDNFLTHILQFNLMLPLIYLVSANVSIFEFAKSFINAILLV